MSTVIHAGGHGLVAAADFLSPYDFFRDLTNPALAFLPRALLIAVVAALVCGSVGVHVVLRGMAFIGDAVAHSVFPGLAIAFVCGGSLVFGGALAGVVTACWSRCWHRIGGSRRTPSSACSSLARSRSASRSSRGHPDTRAACRIFCSGRSRASRRRMCPVVLAGALFVLLMLFLAHRPHRGRDPGPRERAGGGRARARCRSVFVCRRGPGRRDFRADDRQRAGAGAARHPAATRGSCATGSGR